MAVILLLAFVLFGGMIFFAVCGILIERWCEQDSSAHSEQNVKQQVHKKAC